MGNCLACRPACAPLRPAKGITILERAPTQGPKSQVVDIEVQYDQPSKMTEETRESYIQKGYRLSLILEPGQTEISSEVLIKKIKKMLDRANDAQKRTLIIHPPTISTDDPLLRRNIQEALLKQFSIAILEYSSKLNFQYLREVYFEWEESEASRRYEKVRRSMTLLTSETA